MGAWQREFTGRSPAAQKLRAYGRVATEFEEHRSGRGGKAWVLRFLCADEGRASAVVGKYLADLELSQGLKKQELTVGNAAVPLAISRAGAAFVGCVDGAEARVICARDRATLLDFLAARPDFASGAVALSAYPAFLDRFDRWGWGLYGLGGFEDHHGWMERTREGRGAADPLEDLDFLAEHGFRFEPWLDLACLDNSDGLVKNSGAEWMVQEAKRRGLPFSFRVYGVSGGADWTARRFPEYMERPAPFLTSGWHGASQYWKAQPHLSWHARDMHRYIAARVMDMMRPFADEPLAMGWMHPHGELNHDEWYDRHDDHSPAAQTSWRSYLQECGIDLPTATRMYGREESPFGDWDQVPVPEIATFAGLSKRVMSLAGTWFCRVENSGDEGFPDEWWDRPAVERYRGLSEDWCQAPMDLSEWRSIRMPGSDEIFGVLHRDERRPLHEATVWFRRSFIYEDELAPGERLYLYWYPMSFVGIHSGERTRYHGVFLNGDKVGEIGRWGGLDVTDHVKPGENQLALHMMGSVWNGRVFLSKEEPMVYPYLGEERNRLWILWRKWHVDARHGAWAEVLDGMRQVDPDRPIKFMSPGGFGTERWIDLASRYGGWPHFTGEGMWFFPWFKRYGFLYGLPATSELAGPCNNVDEQFAGFRRVFLAGLNGHEPVFVAQVYTRNPELRKWWIDHNPLLKRLGTFDIDGPQVLLYRSTKQTGELVAPKPYPELGIASRDIQDPWDWDIGRGSLQTLGHSYLYLDDGGLADGKMHGYKLMMDCGNETVSEESISSIEAWVRAGGTFVALPFTGRNALLEPDSWPVRRLTGCEIARLRTPGAGKVTILNGQSVFKNLAGRTFSDLGRSMDYIGGNHDILGVELDPGPDCEVLATFENGAPAIVRRKLGRGSVVSLGTAFWRASQDRMGIWWPEEIETDFLADLLNGIGFDAPVCTTDDRLVWAQPYRSNNGLD
jgi:hypothetical protein